jgi:hypothetical protein
MEVFAVPSWCYHGGSGWLTPPPPCHCGDSGWLLGVVWVCFPILDLSLFFDQFLFIPPRIRRGWIMLLSQFWQPLAILLYISVGLTMTPWRLWSLPHFLFSTNSSHLGAICVVAKHFNLILIFFCQSQAFGEVTKHFNLI